VCVCVDWVLGLYSGQVVQSIPASALTLVHTTNNIALLLEVLRSTSALIAWNY